MRSKQPAVRCFLRGPLERAIPGMIAGLLGPPILQYIQVRLGRDNLIRQCARSMYITYHRRYIRKGYAKSHQTYFEAVAFPQLGTSPFGRR